MRGNNLVKMGGRLRLSAFFAFLSVCVFGETLLYNVSNGPIELGVWNNSFAKGKEYAETYNVPMFLFWGSPGCGHCNGTQRACNSQEFIDWMHERKYVMVFDDGGSAGKAFARNSSGQYPYMCVYWPKADGTATTNRFSALSGYFPVETDLEGNQLPYIEKLMASVDYYTQGYDASDFKGGAFLLGDYEGNRLEAVAGKTGYVDVPLTRTLLAATEPGEAVLVAECSSGTDPVSHQVEWVLGEQSKSVAVTIPEGVSPGDVISLYLRDTGGTLKATSAIAVVAEPGNNVKNPDWQAEDFAFGRWTLNYAAAENAVKNTDGAKMIVLFDGTLWCPFCKGMEGSLLADSRLAEWAAAEKIALAMFDQGRASKPATAAGTRAPRLLTYEPDPNLPETNTVSGAGYLSRNMVDRKWAEDTIALTTEMTAKWLAPGSTAARMSQPSILLVKDGEVVARFSASRDSDRVYDPDENLARLRDFVKLWDGPGEQDNYRQTTTRTHSVGGKPSEVDFQINDRTEYFSLAGLAAGRIDLAVNAGEGGSDVVISVIAGSENIATGTNVCSAVVAASMLSKPCYVSLTAYPNAMDPVFGGGRETSEFSAVLTSEAVLIPEVGNTQIEPATETVVMEVETNKVYRLSGFTTDSLADSFDVANPSLGTYVCKAASNKIALTKSGGEVSYQLWEPGTIGFASAKKTVTEAETTIVLKVVRTGGSGIATAVVSLDQDKSAGVDKERYDWAGDITLEWNDGETGEKEVAFAFHDDYVCDAAASLFFGLVPGGEEVETGIAECEVLIKDEDADVAGKLAIAGVIPEFARKMTVVAEEGATLSVVIERGGGAKGAATATVTPSIPSIAPVSLDWPDRGRVVRQTVEFTLPTLAECPAGRFTLTLAGDGIGVDSARRSLTVLLIADNAPMFEATSVEFPCANYAQFSEHVAVIPVGSGKLSATKLSGVLPAGLKAACNAQTKVLQFTGVPTKAGDYTAVYQVSEVVDGRKVNGGTVAVRFIVADVSDAASAGAAGFTPNPSIAESRTFTGVPVFDKEKQLMIGVLTLSLPRTGRASAKYLCTGGTVAMSTASWSEFDTDGTARVVMYSRDGEYSVSVDAYPSGAVNATVFDPSYPGDTIYAKVGNLNWRKTPATDWRGVYTVACRCDGRVSGIVDVFSSGHACFSLKMTTASSLKNGRFQYAGWLPDGTTLSGSATLSADAGDDAAALPVFMCSTRNIFSAPVVIAAGAADAYAEAGEEDPTVQRAIAPNGLYAWWSHKDDKTEFSEFSARYSVYGSWYDATQNFTTALVATQVKPDMTLKVHTEELEPSAVYGVAQSVPDISVGATGNALVGVKLDKASGVVSGTIAIPHRNGDALRNVNAIWRGVVLPGWTGCGCVEGEEDLPFILGSCWFADTYLYSDTWAECTETTPPTKKLRVKRGCAVSCDTAGFDN